MRFLIFAVLFFWNVAGVAQEDCFEALKGKWKNPNNSILSIEQIDCETGQIEGAFISGLGTEGNTYRLVGFANTAPAKEGQHHVIVLSFSVQWGKYGSITSWTGYLEEEDGKEQIRTLFHLVRPNTDFKFEHIISNADLFKKQ